jgi:hypothetical protein
MARIWTGIYPASESSANGGEAPSLPVRLLGIEKERRFRGTRIAIISIIPELRSAVKRSHPGENGFTLVEVLVAALLTAVFFASLFELDAMCLRYIDSSKESLAALQSVHDRLEQLRNRNFNDLTKTDCDPCVPVPPATTCTTIPCVQYLMANPPNSAPIAQRFTEVVTISNYPASTNGVSQYTRTPDGTVTPNLTRTDPTTDLAQIDVQVSWTTTAGSRIRTEQTTCVVANGSKK